jgi:uncharacterized protein (DUF1810 family)
MTLDRFLDGQAEVWEDALGELEAGHKRSHWMWFIFPQLAVLGRSQTAKFFGIRDIAEARAYLAHPVLRARLEACADAILMHDDMSAEEILGDIDALKLRSSATLFRAAGGGEPFEAILDTFYDGEACEVTQRYLDESA